MDLWPGRHSNPVERVCFAVTKFVQCDCYSCYSYYAPDSRLVETTGNAFLHSHTLPVSSHSLPFPFPSSSLIPIPTDCHCVIPPRTRTAKTADSRQSSNRKTVPQETGHQSLKNKNSKTLFTVIRQHYFYSHLQHWCYVSYGGIAQRCTNPWEFSPTGIGVIRIPIYVYSDSFPFSFPKFESYSQSRGIPSPIGNPIHTVMSIWQLGKGTDS